MSERSASQTSRLHMSLVRRSESSMVWVALAGLLVTCAVFEPGTLGLSTLRSMLPFAAVLIVASIGQCLTIQGGGMDLSVSGSMTLAAAIVVGYSSGYDDRIIASIFIALIAVLLGGAVNGLAITVLRVPPIVATLAVNALLVGVVQSYTGGVLKGAPPELISLTSGMTLGLPNLIFVAGLVVLVVAIVVSSTVWGRRLVAVGAQPASARAAGLPVSKYVIGTYVAAAFCFGLAGIMLAGYLQTPSTAMADTYLFSTVTAVVVSGTRFGGGRGRIVGTAVGALFISQLSIFLVATGAPSSTTYILQAAAVAVAVVLNSPGTVRNARALVSAQFASRSKAPEPA